jgi:hypothetical protein
MVEDRNVRMLRRLVCGSVMNGFGRALHAPPKVVCPWSPSLAKWMAVGRFAF